MSSLFTREIITAPFIALACLAVMLAIVGLVGLAGVFVLTLIRLAIGG